MSVDCSKVKTLWIGPSLSTLERLALTSFLRCGHGVDLFVYSHVENVPEGVNIRDANEILGESRIFYYRNRKSVAGFANLFRYEMLYKEGGIWVDTDVICLKKFDFNQRIFFGKEEFGKVNNAVLGAEKGDEFFSWMSMQASNPNKFLPYDEAKVKRRKLMRRYFQGNKPGNVKWGEVGPLGLSRAVKYFDLECFSLPYTAFYPIHPKCWDSIFDDTYPSVERFFPDSYAIHLWNEMFRGRDGFDKNGSFHPCSLIEALKKKYMLGVELR